MKKNSFAQMTDGLKSALCLVTAGVGLTLTACDSDVATPQVLEQMPLAVSVQAHNISRAPIHGTFLPDESTIGISLYNTDGSAYRDGYENICYTASGEGDAQQWSTLDIPTLSSIEAKLVAYHPHADNVSYSAVPVETDTQTDYMYSGWVTGLSNAANEAVITLNHALTCIRVELVNDGFTATADVTGVGVKSDALALAAFLNAATGQLSDLQGQGTERKETVDFEVLAEPTGTEILMVPDVSVTSGITTLTADINGRRYAANINFAESYKQGYIYTYTLSLKNTGMFVTGVNVTPWQDGTEDSGDLGVDKS